MAVMHEKAGQWAKQKSNKYFKLNIGVALGTMLVLGFIPGFLYGNFSLTVASWACVGSLLILLVIVRILFKRAEKWQKERIFYMRGAQAEAFVAWYLVDLPDSWHVFNNLRCADGGDIDHIVVGPGGLFVLSTKSYKGHVTRTPNGTIKLNGQPLTDLDEAMRLAMWVRKRLTASLGDRTPWLQPVLALPHAKVDVPPTEGSVWILGEEQLMETIDAEKPKTKLASGRIAEIVAELERVKAG
jgi:hypothetical protein